MTSRRMLLGISSAVLAMLHCDRHTEPRPPADAPVAARSSTRQEIAPDPDPAPVPAPVPETPDPPCPDAQPLEPVETWTASGPPPSRSSEQVCTALEDRARRAIDPLSGPCETAADCELVRMACPFGCTRAVSTRANRRRARVAFDRYVDECPVCKDKCPALPASLACEDGVCVTSDAPRGAELSPRCR